MREIYSKGVAGQFCAEIELLLVCGRIRVDSEAAAQIKALLGRGINFDYLIAVAQRNGLLPLLYWSLNMVCPQAIPKTVRDHLHGHFRANAIRNMLLTA